MSAFRDNYPVIAAAMFGVPSRHERINIGHYKPVGWLNPNNKWWKKMEITTGKVYTVKATDHTNELAEGLGFNINDRRAVVVSVWDWFGKKVMARVQINPRIWTAPITLDVTDLKA